MIDRAWKIAIAIGLSAGLCAVVLSLFGGSHFHWTWGDAGSNIDVRIGTEKSAASKFLGTTAIICLILGSAFLAISRQAMTPTGMNNNPQSKSFLSFLQNLTRSKTDCWLGGVCGGLGAHTPVPSWVWRVLF